MIMSLLLPMVKFPVLLKFEAIIGYIHVEKIILNSSLRSFSRTMPMEMPSSMMTFSSSSV